MAFFLSAFAALDSFVLGALGRRVAGGAFQQWTGKDIGDLPVRIFFGVTLAAGAWLGGADWQQCLAVAFFGWLGSITGNNNSLGMGRGQTSWLHDFAGMSLHGLISGGLLALPFYYNHWYYPLAAGLACAPAYEAGYRLDLKRGPDWVTGPTQVAELAWGGAMGLGVFLAG